jgi:hypothetical protein
MEILAPNELVSSGYAVVVFAIMECSVHGYENGLLQIGK